MGRVAEGNVRRAGHRARPCVVRRHRREPQGGAAEDAAAAAGSDVRGGGVGSVRGYREGCLHQVARRVWVLLPGALRSAGAGGGAGGGRGGAARIAGGRDGGGRAARRERRGVLGRDPHPAAHAGDAVRLRAAHPVLVAPAAIRGRWRVPGHLRVRGRDGWRRDEAVADVCVPERGDGDFHRRRRVRRRRARCAGGACGRRCGEAEQAARERRQWAR
mmetsp:Transcript_11323/g.39445  ORF Transcript_11323/g.39445 Transcript_11323/m.39445 type:complete len:217 (-) Transcript_11323:136-786(-)